MSPPPPPSAPPSAPDIGTSRQLARAVLEQVERERAFANRALSAALDRARTLSAEERALGTELVYGVLRRQARLDRALDALSDRGLSGIGVSVRIVLRVAAYQLLFLDRVPAYAAVNEAVEACKQLRNGARFAGLANALLRRLADRREPPLPDAAADPLGYLVEGAGLPEWLARTAIAELGPATAVAFGDTVGSPAPLAVRANRLRVDREDLTCRLREERSGAELTASPIAPDALLVRRIDSPFLTRAFTDGLFAIEDVGAQVVAELCGAAPGERILDACAGLGGKSAHLAALAENRAEIDAVDISPAKLRQARELARRLGVEGLTTLAADLTRPWPTSGRRYHRVLLDAPCAGLGVLRRHPEALVRRTPADLPALAAKQTRMLETVAPLVLPGGLLVYSVCTFDRTECEEVVARFLAARPDFRIESPLDIPGTAPARSGEPSAPHPDAAPSAAAPSVTAPLATTVDWASVTDEAGLVRTWPQRHDADAFFAVRLRCTTVA
jgi:16S rRNA (cytosine967-C5)-methyltransferase